MNRHETVVSVVNELMEVSKKAPCKKTLQKIVYLIEEAGGTVKRIEGPHNAPNPHNFNHINYTTPGGEKGTIRIQ